MFASDDDQLPQRNRFTRRMALLGVAQVAAFGAIAGRLYQLQVIEAERYAAIAEDNRTNVQAIAPIRGRILDAEGRVLADNAEGFRVLLTPSLAGNRAEVRAVLDRLARVITLSPADRDRIIARIRRAPPNVPHIVASDLGFQEIATINVLSPELPGIETEIAGRRRYFEGRTMGPVVGFVGALERLALDDDPVLRAPGMKIGKSGVEAGLDERLRGNAGEVRREVDARGRIVRTLERTEPQAGADVTLSIATSLQAQVIKRLEQERRGAIVALDCRTGEVAALASAPAFDPREVIPGVSRDESVSRRGVQRILAGGADPLLNRALRGLYPPGSTFKMVTGLAALEAGVVDLKERLPCEGFFELGGQKFRCWKRSGHGSCDLHRALRESCDCFFYEAARRTGISAIARMGRTLGLGQLYASAGIAQQKSGLIPTPEWKRTRTGKAWLGGETILAAIGQGYVLTTPLQLAVMTARLATGRAVTPTVIRQDDPTAAIPPPLDIKPAYLEAIRRGMAAVVNEDGGTGRNARLDSRKIQVAGKTGTSQVSRKSADREGELAWEERDHALFVAYFPVAQPRWALAGIVEHGGGGGAAAAPLVRDVMDILLDAEDRAKGDRQASERKTGG